MKICVRDSLFILSLGVSLLVLACGDAEVPSAAPSNSAAPAAAAPGGATSKGDRTSRAALRDSAIGRLLAQTPREQRALRLAEWLENAGPDALAEVEAFVQQFRVDETAAEFGLLFAYWADRDPEGAAKWALKPGAARFKQAAVHTAFEAWGRNDPANAINGTARTALEDADTNRIAQMAMIQGWYARDPDVLLEYIKDTGIGIERQRSIFGYALSKASVDGSDAVREWAESIPENDRRFRLSVFRQTMNALVAVDLPAATEWCDKHCDGEWGKSLRKPLMRARLRGGDDPRDVLAWLASTSTETPELAEEQMLSLQIAYATWALKSEEEAMAWIESKVGQADEPEWMSLLYRYYASILAKRAPLDAVTFVNKHISSPPADRERALIAVGQMWNNHDPSGVKRWLDQSDLSEDAKQQVLNFNRPSLGGPT